MGDIILKQILSIGLIVVLIATALIGGQPTTYAQGVDAVSSATTWQEEPAKPVKVAVPAQNQPTSIEGETYTVVAGDVLWRIAKKSQLSIEELLSLNPQITNPNRIYVGQKIVVSKNVVSDVAKSIETGKIYANGTYRGSFYDSGIQQVSIQFSLVDNIVTAVSYRALAYKDIDYRVEKENPLHVAVAEQFEDLIQYMIGKDVNNVLVEMYAPANIVSDKVVEADTITGATVRSSKVISAVYDGLNRGPYSKGTPSISYENGTYRGAFSDGGYQQVGVQFTLEDNKVKAISYRTLDYRGVNYRAEKEDPKTLAVYNQFVELIQHLEGKDIRTTLDDLYKPTLIVSDVELEADTITGATVRSGKVISAINDGLNRGVYAYGGNANPSPSILLKSFENGTYRGSYVDGNEQQVGIQLTLDNNVITNIAYRALAYKGIDYRRETENLLIVAMTEQYNELIQYLVGKDIREHFVSLYWPGEYVKDQTVEADTVSGATIRGNKVASAIIDALNRNPYSK